MLDIIRIGENAVQAKRVLAIADEHSRVAALKAMAYALEDNISKIIQANKIDMQNAKENGLSAAMQDRLMLNEERIRAIAKSVMEIAMQHSVIGWVIEESIRPNGLRVQKVSVPIGVIGIIYESRPNVTVDSAALTLKSGNACILRGGKEAINSNIALANIIREAIASAGLPRDCVQLIDDTSRESANALMRLNGYVDVLIPRGGKGLIEAVCKNSTVPVIETGAGTCHIYVDKDADVDMAAEIIFNAKTSRPSVCNAAEAMLIHKDIARVALPKIAKRLKDSKVEVEIRGDERVCEILPHAKSATDEDWGKEYNDYIIAAKVVDSLEEACEHIYRYGTQHSECIVTDNAQAKEEFLKRVDAAAVYVNASTRFTDGGEFGFGAEIGISTQKLHARGPLGLKELTSYKYQILGDGQVR